MLEDHLKKTQDKLETTQVESNNFFFFWFKDLGRIIVDLLQKLCYARKNEIETEEHMKMLNEHEIGRLKQDILGMENNNKYKRSKKYLSGKIKKDKVHTKSIHGKVES